MILEKLTVKIFFLNSLIHIFRERLRLNRHASRATRFILVYTMGKVGSESVLASLQARFPREWVYHGHFLLQKSYGFIEESARTAFQRRLTGYNFFCFSRALSYSIRRKKIRSNLRVISLVRDPIATNISLFFQMLDRDKKLDWAELKTRPLRVQLNTLLPLYLENPYVNLHPRDWFREELGPSLGVDIYKEAFDKSKGYKIYQGAHPQLLIIKLEKIQGCVQEAMDAFLQTPNFEIIRENTSAKKEYGELYRKFLEEIELPKNYLDEVYQSRLVSYFYTQDEIDGFRARWSKGKK